jgi:hypothetical protein
MKSIDPIVRSVLARRLDCDVSTIRSRQELESNIALTPLELVLIALDVEEIWGVDWPIEELVSVRTVGALVSFFFLACMKEGFPVQYGMTFLGFVTGLRPSSMRPLRRTGPTPDVLWDDGVVLVRRSHTLGDEVMLTTKTGLRQRITVPSEVIDVLKWHVDTQIVTPEQKASDLLFPAEDGGFRSEAFLRKALAEVGHLIGLKKTFTPRGMRRTFNDLARLAKVEALVTKSISGHQTDRMKDHYSTVHPTEQRESIGRLLYLVRSTGEGETKVS